MDDGIASGLHRHDVRPVTPLDLERVRRVVGRRRKARAAAAVGGGLLLAAATAGVLTVGVPTVPDPDGHPVAGAPRQTTAVDTTARVPEEPCPGPACPTVSVPSQGDETMRLLEAVMASHEARDVDYDVLDVSAAEDTLLSAHTVSDDAGVRTLRGMFEAGGATEPLPTGNSAIMFTVETNVCEPGLLVRGVERRGDHVVVRLRDPLEGSDCVNESRDGYLLTLAVPSRQIEGTGGALVAPDGE